LRREKSVGRSQGKPTPLFFHFWLRGKSADADGQPIETQARVCAIVHGQLRDFEVVYAAEAQAKKAHAESCGGKHVRGNYSR